MRNKATALLVLLILALSSSSGRAQAVVSADVAIDVSASATWTQALLHVGAGDTLFIYASGAVGPRADSIDWRDWSGPEGVYPVQAGGCSDCPLPGYPLRSLIARIGDGQPFFIGSFAAIGADASGVLYIGINESSPDDNAGTMRAFIWRGGEAPTGFETRNAPAAPFVVLYPNFPNPFNPSTTLSFYLAEPAIATLDVFDVSGRLVVRLWNRMRPAGANSIVWTGNDGRGVPAASGVYFCRLRAGGCVRIRKVVLIR